MRAFAIVAAAGLALPAFGQWSTNPEANLPIADHSGEQTQPKIAARADGGCYISWFDNHAGGYDVYLQRLSRGGVEQWPHNGILIADRSVSSTIDYDLAIDAQGNALLVYNDDTVIPGTQQIQLQRVSPAGELLFGPQGIMVSDGGSEFKSNPHVTVLGNGDVVVGFTSNSTIFLQRYSPAGTPQWAAPIAISELFQAPSTLHSITLSDLQPGGIDSVIALYVRSRTSSFLSNKSLYAQKFSAAGAPLWTGSGTSTGAGNPVVVFDAGTTTGVQNGYFPSFIGDGSGGAIFSWYETGGERHAYIQHILSSGAPKFPAPIASAASTPGRIRLGASASRGGNDEYVIAAPEGPAATTIADSLHIQRLTSSGERMWGPSGIHAIAPSPAAQPTAVHCIASFLQGQSVVLGINPAGSGESQVFFFALDSAGVVASTAMATAPGPKSRLAAARSSEGYFLAAFVQGDTASADILAQNVSATGVLGPPHCYPNCDGSTTPPILNVADFSCFLTKFSQQDPYANCDGSTVEPVLNVADFSCFLSKFAAGCP
jgi:hypothetical protein